MIPGTCAEGPRADLSSFFQRDPLPTTFTCLFCNHEKSIEVKLDKKVGCGWLDCKVCGQKFQCSINCTLPFPFEASSHTS